MTNRAVFSVFSVETKKDIERLLKPAIKGKCRIVAKEDGYFRGKDYCSKTLNNPSWADLLEVFDEQIAITKDDHHVFLEGVVKCNKKTKAGGIPEYEFLTGS